MGAIIIKADNRSSKILKDLAEQLGASVTDIKEEQYEDFLLGTLMDLEKTGKTVPRESIFKKTQIKMIVEYDKSFGKWLSKIKDSSILNRIEKSIINLENVKSIEQIPNSIKLTGYKLYYRIKIGDYRLGFEKINKETIRLIIIAHRKEIYKRFP